MRPIRRFFLPALLVLAASPTFAADYHGFRIDESRAQLSPDEQASLFRQLDIIEAAALPPAVLDAMKQTPVIVDPELRGNPGIFAVRNGVPSVYVRPLDFPPNKPILLHEFLHAYHFGVIHLDRAEVQEEFQLTKRSSLFPARFQSSHFLENAKEFFAVTGTLYLFGNIQQPPFDCTALSRLRPQYLAFLREQFGPSHCPGLTDAVAGVQPPN
jgi:hypothetical protein